MNTNTLVEVGRPLILSVGIDASTITLTYDEPLDVGSVPATTDYELTVNAAPVAVTEVAIVNSTVVLTIASTPVLGDVILLDYTAPVVDTVQDSNSNNAISFIDYSISVSACSIVLVGDRPVHAAVFVQEVYIVNKNSSEVQVINTITNTVTDMISVGSSPVY